MSNAAPLLNALAARRGERHANWIGGEDVEAASGERFVRANPADTREIVASYPRSGAQDVAAAVEAAGRAFPGWRDTPPSQRGEVIERARRLLEARAEEMAQALSWEEGKTLAESRQEVGRAVAYLAFVAGEGRRLGGETLPSDGGGLNYVVRRPLGVVGLITPWNFPINIPVIKSAPALLAGNTVVLKPSELAPLCAVLLAEIYRDAGLPAGAFNLVHGDEVAGRALVEHPGVRAISFTGSTAVGRDINQRAAARFARVQLEMGGKNPAIVLADADLERAAADVALGGFSTTGQRCNATSLVFVERSVHDAFAERLVARAKALTVGPGLEEASSMGPLVEPSARERVLGYVERAREAGATVLAGGGALAEGPLAHGHFMAPTVVTGVDPAAPIACEEIFGPLIALVPIADLAEGLAIANRSPYGLASALYTRDLGAALRYAERCESGLLHVNCPTTLSEPQMPYGGLKASGHGGREMGRYVFDFYTEWQAVYLRP